jgi:hypothetical protein
MQVSRVYQILKLRLSSRPASKLLGSCDDLPDAPTNTVAGPLLGKLSQMTTCFLLLKKCLG